ncbi:MAG: hypothetical protein ACI9F9_002737 [Candidatus Paceibacteria bacterium]|jgi:hypothetical protein
MTRLLHYILLGGCGAIVAIFSPLAWQSALACELPVDCRASISAKPVLSDLIPEAKVESEGMAALESVKTS